MRLLMIDEMACGPFFIQLFLSGEGNNQPCHNRANAE